MRPSPSFKLVTTLLIAGICSCACEAETNVSAEKGAALEEQSAPPAPQISRVTLTGEGCPTQDGIAISGDRRTFGVEFDAFDLEVYAGKRHAEAECSISVEIDAPAGVAYAPAGMDAVLYGSSAREEPASVTLSTSSKWSDRPGESPISRSELAARGRATKRVFDVEDLWSACDGERALQLHTRLTLTGRRGAVSLRELANMRFRATKCGGTRDSGTDGGVEPRDGGVSLPDAGPVPTPAATVSDVQLVGPCGKPGVASVALTAEERSFDVAFRDFKLANDDLSTECTMWFDLTPPPGYKATIRSYVVDGVAEIPSDSLAVFRSTYNPSGIPGSVSMTSVEHAGPRQGAFSAVVDFTDSGLVFPECRTQNMTLFFSPALVPSAIGAASLQITRLHSLSFALLPCP